MAPARCCYNGKAILFGQEAYTARTHMSRGGPLLMAVCYMQDGGGCRAGYSGLTLYSLNAGANCSQRPKLAVLRRGGGS